jgi:tetratricopeptide (TPR) repeat protein
MAIPQKYLKSNCLVVDDELSTRLTIKNMLAKMGFEKIILTENGKMALEFIKTVKIDMAFVDVNMPVMSGVELFKTVREDRRYDNIVFIFVTAESRRPSVARVAEEGGDGYIIKPFIMATLEDRILKTLEKKVNPRPFRVYLKNFDIFLENKEFQNAENELKKASELDPESPLITYRLGQLAIAMGDKDKAIGFYKETIDLNPLFIKAYSALSEIYEYTGDIESAINYHELAQHISPENTKRLITLSKLYSRIGETEKSKEILRTAVSAEKDVSTSDLLLGEMFLAQNENQKAVELLIKANKENQSDVSIMQSLAEAYRRVANPREAIKIYKEIIKIKPKNAYAYYAMGKAYLEMNVKDKAVEYIKKAWELNPFSLEIITTLKDLAEKEKINI